MAAADASPGVMTSPPYTEQHVAVKIKEWVAQQTNAETKTHVFKDVVSYIESIVGRQISCLETTWIERQYVKIVLEMWLSASFEKAFADLEKSFNFNTQISELLRQLKLINSFENILKLPAESKLRDWCECRYLQLILGQTSLFKTTPRFAILVPSYFHHFKTSMTDQILSRCRKGLTEDQINFISALIDFMDKAINGATNLQDILEENFLENEFGKESLKNLVDTYGINNQNEVAPDWFHHFKSLADNSWTPLFNWLVKETCESFLLPKTVVDVQKEDGKEIISIKGVAVFSSKILQEMINLKRQNSNVKEIKIVGLLSVHVDCDLESKDWHGMNVGIVTDKLYVDKKVCWDVSGQHENHQPEGKYNFIFSNGCHDVRRLTDLGKPGQPGESGGNIHVICQEMISAEKWTIISDGGNGRDGQNGAFRKIEPDEKHRKWSKEEFQEAFPTMSTFDDSASEKAMETVLATLLEILPVNTRIKGEDVVPGYRKDFYIRGTTKEGSQITITYYKGKRTRHTLIYSKGNPQ
jgi:hypothetical protein